VEILLQGARWTAAVLLDGRSPHLIAHPLLIRIVVVGLSAVRATDVIVVGVIHVVLLVLSMGIRVDVGIVTRTRRRQSLLRGRLPAHRGHVGAAVGAAGPYGLVVIGGCRRLQDRRRAVTSRVRSDCRALVADVGVVRLRREGGRRAGAGLRHLIAKMRGHVHTGHVVVVGVLTVHAGNNTSRHAGSWGERQRSIGWGRRAHGRGCLRIIIAIRTRRPGRSRGT
jgi:hypothetical protein